MNRYLPLVVQPYRMALKQLSLVGLVPAVRLPRFTGEFNLVEPGIQVVAEFDGVLDSSLASVDLTLNAGVILQCERCLKDFNWQLNHKQRLWIARKEEDIQGIADNTDFIVCEDEDLEIAKLIEDELFLALPQIPMHESLDECDPIVKKYLLKNESGELQRQNPFSVLKKM